MIRVTRARKGTKVPRTKKDIRSIIVHCSASGPKTTLEDIKKWHKQRGWKDVGYHYVILADGKLKQGREWQEVGAHCQGQNRCTLGICLVGGNDGKTLHKFSQEQMKTLEILIEGLRLSFGNIPIYGHRDFAKKECPNFDVHEWEKTKKVVYLR